MKEYPYDVNEMVIEQCRSIAESRRKSQCTTTVNEPTTAATDDDDDNDPMDEEDDDLSPPETTSSTVENNVLQFTITEAEEEPPPPQTPKKKKKVSFIAKFKPSSSKKEAAASGSPATKPKRKVTFMGLPQMLKHDYSTACVIPKEKIKPRRKMTFVNPRGKSVLRDSTMTEGIYVLQGTSPVTVMDKAHSEGEVGDKRELLDLSRTIFNEVIAIKKPSDSSRPDGCLEGDLGDLEEGLVFVEQAEHVAHAEHVEHAEQAEHVAHVAHAEQAAHAAHAAHAAPLVAVSTGGGGIILSDSSRSLQAGMVVSIDPVSGNLVQGYRPSPAAAAARQEENLCGYDAAAAPPPPAAAPRRHKTSFPVSHAYLALSGNKGLLYSCGCVCVPVAAPEACCYYVWMVMEKRSCSSCKLHLFLVRETMSDTTATFRLENMCTLNDGKDILSNNAEILLLPTAAQTPMLLIYYLSAEGNKNKVEVVQVDVQGSRFRAMFGPANLAGEGMGSCKAAIVDHARVVLARSDGNCVELIGADLSKLPAVTMGTPVRLLEKRTFPDKITGILTYALDVGESGGDKFVYVLIPKKNDDETYYYMTLISGQMSDNGQAFLKQSESPYREGSGVPACIPVNCALLVEPSVMAIAYNTEKGFVLESSFHEERIVLTHRHASPGHLNDIYIYIVDEEAEGKTDDPPPPPRMLCVFFASPARRKGFTYLVNSVTKSVHEHVWDIPYSAYGDPDKDKYVVVSGNTSTKKSLAYSSANVLFPNGQWCYPFDLAPPPTSSSSIASASHAGSASASQASSASASHAGSVSAPLGIVTDVLPDGRVTVCHHGGLFFRRDNDLQSGKLYYAHHDGTWSLHPDGSRYVLGLAVSPCQMIIYCTEHLLL